MTAKNQLYVISNLKDRKLPDMDLHNTQPAVSRFGDGYDENLLGDAPDRARLEGLSKLERECELYEPSLKRQEQLYKWGIEGGFLSKKKLNDLANRSDNITEKTWDMKQRYSTRHLNTAARRVAAGKRIALDQLLADRNSKRAKFDCGIVHITPTQADEMEQKMNQDLEPKSEPYNLSSRTPTQPVNGTKLKALDVHSYEANSDVDMDSRALRTETLLNTLPELNKALLTRSQLENFLDKPIFNETVIDCFVRISIGAPSTLAPCIYRLTRVMAVQEAAVEYQLGSQRTKSILLLQVGAHQRNFQMDMVSNQPVSHEEFQYWLQACERDALSLPSLRIIAKKEKDIEMATNYIFTEDDIQLLLQKKNITKVKPCRSMERKPAVGFSNRESILQQDHQSKESDDQSHEGNQRVQYTSTNDPVLVKKTTRLPKMLDLQQYMLRRYKKIENLSLLHANQEHDQDSAAESIIKPDENMQQLEENERKQVDIDSLDLYELHDFVIDLDVSQLAQFSEIFADMEIEETPTQSTALAEGQPGTISSNPAAT